jgi:hypothetical protein
MPPIQMHELYSAHPKRFRRLEARERRMRTWRGFRNWGDHFLMVLRNVVD